MYELYESGILNSVSVYSETSITWKDIGPATKLQTVYKFSGMARFINGINDMSYMVFTKPQRSYMDVESIIENIKLVPTKAVDIPLKAEDKLYNPYSFWSSEYYKGISFSSWKNKNFL